jgi:hypothetical protein
MPRPTKSARFAREVTQARLQERLASAPHRQPEVWMLSDVEGVIDPNELALIRHTQLGQHSVDQSLVEGTLVRATGD